jgi:haloacetate dehalogenase
MSELADLFPNYESRRVQTSAGKLFARLGGAGSPLLLLHGYPQTHAMWHRVAPALARQHSLVIADLPGYGASDAPGAGPGHSPYNKRAMAKAMVELMEALGHQRFVVVGHDRGGRVAYRLALDHRDRVSRLAVLDIVPTYDMWAGMDAKRAMHIYHWTFLAQPAPLPETLIGKAPVEYLEWTLGSWTHARDMSAFDPRALAHYRAAYAEPKRIHAMCEDYRAGQSMDVTIDAADVKAGRKIACPVLALWGSGGFPAKDASPLDVWKKWATDVEGKPIESGHFLAEENPDTTAAALLAFLAKS